jgi:hypothetical protein
MKRGRSQRIPSSIIFVVGTVCGMFLSAYYRIATKTFFSSSLRGSDDYSAVYQQARSLFGYESPLPHWPPTKEATTKFARIPQLFPWNVASQIVLWRNFVRKNYVKREHLSLLADNGGMYPDLDRVVLFAILQHIKPRIVLEIGSGESTHVAMHAINLIGTQVKHIAIEPYRYSAVPKSVEIIKSEVQTLGFELYDKLSENDVLFIDSSHVTMPFGDTLTELLTILPRLSKGVLVHIHDIFLPFDYIPDWGLQNKIYTEQWLVALMLYGADDVWEVVWSSRLMMKEHAGVLLEMDNYPFNPGQKVPNGGSLWIRKLGPPIR